MDFLTKQRIKRRTENGVTESYPVREDVFNYQGGSLFVAYKQLWDAVHDFDLGIAPNNTSVEHAFAGLSTFAIDDIVPLMTDYIRKLLRVQLGVLFLPYTIKQQNAIRRLRYLYPLQEEDKQRILKLQAYAETLIRAMDVPYTDEEGLQKYRAFEHYITKLVNLLYTVPKDQLWVVYERAQYALWRTREYKKDDNKINTALEYLAKYKKQSTDLVDKTFEAQLVDDITTCLIYSYPHPEMVLALENALNILDLYYTQVEASKLFIYDVRHKIKRYLLNATNTLDPRLIEWFRNGQRHKLDEEATKEPETIEHLYQVFLETLNHYQVTGKGYQSLVEQAYELKRRPYDDVRNLPSFIENMNIVENINPFKNKPRT